MLTVASAFVRCYHIHNYIYTYILILILILIQVDRLSVFGSTVWTFSFFLNLLTTFSANIGASRVVEVAVQGKNNVGYK